MSHLRSKSGQNYVEVACGTDTLLKVAALVTTGVAAYVMERWLDKLWNLSADGFYVLQGIYWLMFAWAFLVIAFPRVIRLENGISGISVKSGFRLLRVVPLLWTHDCIELRLEYVKGRDKRGNHVKMGDFWRIRGVRRDPSFWGWLVGDLATYSRASDATAFMAIAGDFARTVRDDLPAPTIKSIRLLPS